ncbi:MAG: S-layer protein [Firmicutes bacterium]|nr:S-layer protein [Bacillota bacterium]
MKKCLAVLLTLFIMLATSGGVFAASAPFTDVPAGHWSYSAVKRLAADGIIEGSNSVFDGNKTITRYEFAVLLTRIIAKQDKASAEDKALIQKLTAEYKAELAGLDVRLKTLENKTDRLQIYGNARIRYDNQSSGSTYLAKATEKSAGTIYNTYDDQHINLDVQFIYAVADGWQVKVESQWQRQFNFPEEMNTAGLRGQAEQVYITGPWANGTLNIGKFSYVPGYGLTFYGKASGVQYSFGSTVQTTIITGHTDTQSYYKAADVVWNIGKDSHIKAAFSRVAADPGAGKYYEVGFDTKIANDFLFEAAAGKGDLAGVSDNNKSYFGQIQYKVADPNVVGSSDVFVNYYKIPSNAAYDRSDADDDTSVYTWHVTETYNYGSNFKGTHIGFDYVPMKNSKITVWYLNGKDADTGTETLKVFRGQFMVYF